MPHTVASSWSHQKVNQLYDISAIEKRLMAIYPNATPPRVLPGQLQSLIDLLQTVTKLAIDHSVKVEKWLSERGGTVDLWLQYNPIKEQLNAWDERLQTYAAKVKDCPQDDATCTLWTVVAPMFFGFYGGAASKEPERDHDVMTAFRLANRLNDITEADVTSNMDALLDAAYDSAKAVGGVVIEIVVGTVRVLGEAAGAGAAAGAKALFEEPAAVLMVVGVTVLGMWWFFGRPRRSSEE